MMWTLVRLVCACAVLGVCCGYQDKTVYQYLVDKGYTGFIQLLRETGQDSLLQGPGPVTVFAPSNAAIARMSPDVMATMARNVWQKSELVKYHLIQDFVLIPTLSEVRRVITSAGQPLYFTHLGHTLFLNNKTSVNGPPDNDIICRNGVVQPIDSVLIPPLYGTDNLVAVLIERDDLFQEFLMSLLLNNMTTQLENSEYTIFAPVDSAYLKFLGMMGNAPAGQPVMPPDTVAMIRRESSKYHLVPGARSFEQLKNGEQLFTLHGTPLNITTLTNGKLVNKARIIHPNIPAANGIIHGIDDALFPKELLHLLPPEVQKYFQS